MTTPSSGSASSGDPRVCVIIARRDRDDELWRTLRSVRGQSVIDYEAVLVGGPQPTGPLAELFASSERWTWLPYEPACTIGQVWNHGLRRTQAPWLAVLDGSTVWTEDFLAKALAHIDRHPEFDVIATQTMTEVAPGVLRPLRHPLSPAAWKLDELFAAEDVEPSAFVIRRSVWERHGGFDEELTGLTGHHFLLKSARGHPIGVIDEALVLRQRRSPLTATQLARHCSRRAEMLHRFYLEQQGHERLDGVLARRVLAQACWRGGWLAMRQQQRARSARLFRGAAYHHPNLLTALAYSYAERQRQRSGEPTILLPEL